MKGGTERDTPSDANINLAFVTESRDVTITTRSFNYYHYNTYIPFFDKICTTENLPRSGHI